MAKLNFTHLNSAMLEQEKYSGKPVTEKERKSKFTPDTPTTASPITVTHNELLQLPHSSLRHLVRPTKSTISIQFQFSSEILTQTTYNYSIK